MGKRTTTRHKEDNTFRFQTFEEKLRQISVNVNLSIRDGRAADSVEGSETFFSQEIEKWVDLNRTESFASLLCNIGTDSRTLAQVLLEKDTLAKVLDEHLRNPENVASFEPAFGLVVALSRDLGEEFYPHFQTFFETIIKIVIESKSTNIIEAGFKCYAYLTKYLRKQIIRDLQHHLKMFSCFLNPKLKTYVVIFACEAFSAVAGKFARDHPEKFLKLIFGTFLRKSPEHAVGIATLLFAIFKGIGGTLKLEGPGMRFKECFTHLARLENQEDVKIWTDMLNQLVLRLLKHANPSNSLNLIRLVESLLEEIVNEKRNVANVLKVYVTMIEFNNAGKFTDVEGCSKVLQGLSPGRNRDDEGVISALLSQAVIKIIESKCSPFDTEILNYLQPVIQDLLQIASFELLENLDKCLRGFRAYFRMFLEPIMSAYSRTKSDHPLVLQECPNISVYCLSEAILQQGGFYQLSDEENHYFAGSTAPMAYFQDQTRIITMLNASSLKGTTWNCCSLMKNAEADILHGIPQTKVGYYVRLLMVFSRLNSKNCETCLQTSISILRKMLQLENLNALLPAVYYIFQIFISQPSPQSYEHIPVKELLERLITCSTGALSKLTFCMWSLKTLDVVVYYINVTKHDEHLRILKELMKKQWCVLSANLQSGFRMIRALTLSILKATIGMNESEESIDKTVEMLDKFLELEDMSLTNSKYSSLAKSILVECKVIMGSENHNVNLKLFCLKYTLGLMYTNFNLIWTPCVDAIRQGGKHIDLPTYWEVFGTHFCLNVNYPNSVNEEALRTNILPAEIDALDFLDQISVRTLGLPKSESGHCGYEEQLDIFQYKTNLWLSLKGQTLTKTEYNDIKGFIGIIIDSSVDQNDETGLSKRERSKMIIPVLQFLETCDLVNANELWESVLKYLTYAPDVQKAAWKFLFAKRKNKLKNYKEDIDEVINSDTMDTVHKFCVEAVDVTLNKRYENESLDRRSLLMDLIIRILIGKERVMKGEKRIQVLRFIAGCTELDARKYLDITVGSSGEVQHLPPKIIEIKINKMTSALRIWRYKFPNILDQMVNSICDLACAVSSALKPLSRRSLDPEEQIPDDIFEEQKKAAMKAGRLAIVAFFTSLPRLDIKSETLNRIFDVFIWSALNDLSTTSVGSVSWILKLFLVWSTHERYHPLFTKCKGENVQLSPMWKLFDLLDSNSTVFEVKKYILGIILNLTNPPEITEDDETQSEEFLNCSNSPLQITELYTFDTSESIGVNIVLLRKEVILNLFQDSQTFKKFTTQTGGSSCLSLISLLAGFASDGKMNEKLCSVIIDTFPMCKNNEESLFNSIVAVGKLLLKIEHPFQLIMKVSTSFSWLSGRRLRIALVEALECINDTPLYDIISGMNAWTDMATDTPNFSRRQESFDTAEKYILNDSFDLLGHALIFYNCVFNVTREDDLGLRNSARNLLVSMASSLRGKIGNSDRKTDVHKLLDSVVLPKLRGGVHEKDDKRFEDLLRILYAFVDSCRDLHGTFKNLAKVLSTDIIEGLCDIQVHLRTRSMNRLGKRLKEIVHDVSPAVTQAFILPIGTHNLFDEERLSKNFNELIDSSIEVLKVVMSATSQDFYFSYLNRLLDDPKKNTRLAKQFERVLIAIMDTFHFDLSLACQKETKTAVEIKNCDNNQPSATEGTSANTKSKTEENGDLEEESDEEEFNIPKKPDTPEALTLTLVPEAAAVRCLGILKSSIIPKLRKFLHFEETATHKLSRTKKKVDDDVILKIPCTIALVKLLKKIPKSEGQNGIRSIIPSITAGLRNELVSVRNTLRKTLLNVIKELGISHLKVVIGYLKSSLQRGYQKHVLNYTVAYLLRCLESDLKAQPYHVPVKEVISLCEEELYGHMMEEKEVTAIKQKTREASKSNACPILKVCSKFVSTIEQLNSLVDPAIKHITEKKSIKVAKSSRQWLISVSEGLADNSTVNHEELLRWLLEVTKKDGADLSGEKGSEEQSEDQPPNKRRKLLETPKDSKLIPLLPKRSISEKKVGGQSLLTEFSFTCLYNGLNKSGCFRDKLSNMELCVLFDDYVPILADGIKATSKQVNVVSLRSITFLFEYELPNFKKPEIIGNLQRNGFIAMSNHCYRNTTDSETTNATFKFLSAFFLRFPDFKIVLQDFELMLKCIQGYLTDGNCSSSALTLLKGVLQNKYSCSALPELMQEVFNQCITSYHQHVNEGCRLAYLTYLNNYLTNPKELYVEVQLVLRQLDYKLENGRTTAAEILNALLQNIPKDCFEEVKELIFFKLLATLDKEKMPKVRERLGDGFKLLFKLDKRKSLIRILLKLIQLDNHIPEFDTFFLIIGLIIDDPKIFNNDDMAVIIGRIKDVLEPSTFMNMCAKELRVTQQIKDYIIFQALVAFKKALGRKVSDVSLWSHDSPLADQIQLIFNLLRETYLLYEHEWVPLVSVDILSIVLNQMEMTDDDAKIAVAKSLELESPACAFLQNSNDLNELMSQLWEAMMKSEREDVLAKGAFVLVLLLSVAGRLDEKEIFKGIVSSIRKSVNGEVVHSPRVTTIRSIALGCFRGIAKTCPRDAIADVVEIMTRVAVRELTDDNISQEIKDSCEKLITVLREAIGNSAFNVIHAKANDFLHKKRNLNRAKKKETAVLHPGLVRKRPKKGKPTFPSKKRRKT